MSQAFHFNVTSLFVFRFSRNLSENYGPLVNTEGAIAGYVLKIIVDACEKAGYIGSDRYPDHRTLLLKLRKTMGNITSHSEDTLARTAFPPGTSSQTQEDTEYAQKKKLKTLKKREDDRLRKEKERQRKRDKKKVLFLGHKPIIL